MHRRAQLACLVFAGLRIDEHVSLDWRDVDLLAGRLQVRASKTAAGTRYVTLRPTLRDELAALKDELAKRDGGKDPGDNTPVPHPEGWPHAAGQPAATHPRQVG